MKRYISFHRTIGLDDIEGQDFARTMQIVEAASQSFAIHISMAGAHEHIRKMVSDDVGYMAEELDWETLRMVPHSDRKDLWLVMGPEDDEDKDPLAYAIILEVDIT